MTLLALVLRSFRARPGRALMTLGSVIIGVAGIVSVGLAMNTTRGAYQKMYEALAGKAALEVIAATDGQFSENIVHKLSHLPGIAAAVPSLRRFAVLHHDHERAKVLVLGIDPDLDRKVHDYELVGGEFFHNGEGILLEASFARSMGIKLHDEVRVLAHGLKTARVVGLLAPQGVASVSQGTAMFLPLPVAQRWFSSKGQIHSVQIVLKRGAHEDDVRGEIENALPKGLRVRPPATRTQLADDTLNRLNQALDFVSAVLPVLAAFIIINAFLMNISERRKQLATMRAIGATRRQVVRLLLAEGFVLGVLGTALGELAGFGGAVLLTWGTESLLQMALPAVSPTWRPPVLGVVLGMMVSLGSTYLPAYRASRISPLEGLRALSRFEFQPTPVWVTTLGALLLAGGMGLMIPSLRGEIDPGNMVTAGLLCLFGCVLLLPVTLRPASEAIGALLQLLLPIEARLAQRQVLRRRIRTALTAAVLFFAITAGIGFGLTIINNLRDIDTWTNRTIQGDFFVRATKPGLTMDATQDVPESLGAEIEKIPGITYVARARLVEGDADGQHVQIIAKDLLPGEGLPLDLRVGNPEEIRRRLDEGEVVVGLMLAQKTGLDAGDDIEIDSPLGERRLRIAGVANEYMAGGMTVFMKLATARRELGIQGVTFYIIKAEPSLLTSAEAELQAICDRYGLLLQSHATLIGHVQNLVNAAIGGLWVLLALCFLVASFGIVNTLTMNVLEQTRELALLRAVAMTRRQMRRMIFCQATIIGLFGLLPGAFAGAALAWLINAGTSAKIGHPITFRFDVPMMVFTFLCALVMVIFAALVPAIRASRLNVISALKQE